MPNIKPISDLRNYTEVLSECREGEPIYLTKEGRGSYVILEINEYEKQLAMLEFFEKIAEAEEAIKR